MAKIKLGKVYGSYGTSRMTTFNPLRGEAWNPDKVKVKTYRKMLDDYQIAACINIYAFTFQKIDWYYTGGKKNVNDFITYATEIIWNQLVKSIAKGFWAGYSPSTKVYEYDKKFNRIIVSEIRDLVPEDCKVIVDKNGDYDGFSQSTTDLINKNKIPPIYTFWYTHQKMDGNHYGKSMLRPAYKPWFYSELIHTFANRYYERFGEPVVKGSAPNETIEDSTGTKKNAVEVIQSMIEDLKSHATLTIPREYDENGNLMFDVEYLESQMRGADFNSYLNRLDMEKARAIFVPDLLFGTGRVGSYELGKEHKATFMNGLMGIVDDVAQYIQKYYVEDLIQLNFGAKTEVPKFTYMPLTQVSQDALLKVVGEVIKVNPDIIDIENLAPTLGIPLKDAEEVNIKKDENIDNTPTDSEKDENMRKQPVIKKQFERVSNYIRNIYHSIDSDDIKLKALHATKLGYSETFNKDNYTRRENRVKEYLVNSFKNNESLPKILSGLGKVVGVKSKKSYLIEKTEQFKKQIDEVIKNEVQ